MLYLTDELFDDISFHAQDVWSLGCLLVWLVTEEVPFFWDPAESDSLQIGHLECMCMKHDAWVRSHNLCSFDLLSCTTVALSACHYACPFPAMLRAAVNIIGRC